MEESAQGAVGGPAAIPVSEVRQAQATKTANAQTGADSSPAEKAQQPEEGLPPTVPRKAWLAGKAGIFAAGLMVVLLVMVGLAFLKPPPAPSWPDKDNPRQNLSTPPVSIIPTIPPNTNNQTPWGYSFKPLASPPEKPTAEELDGIYRQIRKAVRTRNLSFFEKFASASKRWAVENPKKLIGEVPDGLLFEYTGHGGGFFSEAAPYHITFQAPPEEDLVPMQVEEHPKTSEGIAYIFDPASNTTDRVNITPWLYRYRLRYGVSNASGGFGDGYVLFVFDKDSWAYESELWKYSPPYRRAVGDETATGTELFFVANTGKEGAPVEMNYSPITIQLPAGAAARWTGVTGIIYSRSGEPWDSGYLNGSNFTRVFHSPGEINYSIGQAGSFFEGRVVVLPRGVEK